MWVLRTFSAIIFPAVIIQFGELAPWWPGGPGCPVPRAPGGPSPGDHPRVSGVYHSEEECYESGFLIFANTNKPFNSVLGFNQVFVYEVATSVCLSV